MINYMTLNKGACLICGNQQIFFNYKLSPEQARFFGAPNPEGRVIDFSLCEDHKKACFTNGTPSGFPDTATLEAAIQNAIDTYDYSEEKADQARIRAEIENLLTVAKHFTRGGAYLAAVKELRKAIRAAEMESFMVDYGCSLYSAMAEACMKSEDHNQAIKYYRSAIDAFNAEGNKRQAADLAVDLAQSLFRMKQHSAALSELKAALSFLEKDQKNPKHLEALRLSGVILADMQQTTAAAEYFAKAEALASKTALKAA